MAESADILARPGQVTVLPDLNAGCSMADMAEITQVEDCWEHLVRAGLTNDAGDGVTPITYMNSTAAIKAFCGERGGVVCTSSNAAGAFHWGFAKNSKLLFLPDQHLGRNTGYKLGIPLDEMAVWNPYMLNGGIDPERLKKARVILWKGHCSVHQRFLPEHVDNVRAKYPGVRVIVHDHALLAGEARPAAFALGRIGKAGEEHAIDIALEQGGNVAPPQRRNQRDHVGGAQRLQLGADVPGRPAARDRGQVARRQQRIEAHRVKIAARDAMPARLERRPIGRDDGAVEALGARMREDNEVMQISLRDAGVGSIHFAENQL